MHGTCMATKTISLELDAYERLRRFKRSPRESFSAVVRRAVWPDAAATGDDILADLRHRATHPGSLPDESILEQLDRVQAESNSSQSEWNR